MLEDHCDLGLPNIPVGSIGLQLLNVVKEFGSDMVCSRGRHSEGLLKVSSLCAVSMVNELGS